MRNNNFPKIPLLISVIFFAFSCFAFFFFFKEIKSNNEESQLRESKWQEETLRRDGIKALDHSVKVIERERGQLDTHFAQSSDIVPFLDTIEGLSKKVDAQAEVTSVDVGTNGSLTVGMKASGTFGSLYKF